MSLVTLFIGNVIVLSCILYESTFARRATLKILSAKRYYFLQLLKSSWITVVLVGFTLAASAGSGQPGKNGYLSPLGTARVQVWNLGFVM